MLELPQPLAMPPKVDELCNRDAGFALLEQTMSIATNGRGQPVS
jgi:hypothetical protein